MTRIFTDGAEMGDVLFWDVFTGGITASTTQKRSGSYSYSLSGNSTVTKNFTAISEAYFRIGYYHNSYNGNTRLAVLRTITSDVMSLRVSATNRLDAYVGGTLTATSEQSIVDGIWFLLEFYFLEADVNGRIIAKIDGVTWIDYTGDTKPSTGTTFDNLFSYSGSTYNYIDDLGMNDTTGDFDNSWCGDGHIERLNPSGSGTLNQFSNSGSTSGSSNYEYVDEFPYDGNSTYVYCSGSNAGFQDRYKLSTFDGKGKTISRIYGESRSIKIYDVEGGISIGYLPNGGTTVMSGSVNLTTGSYMRAVSTSGSTNPVTGLEWTEDDINALEYVCEI